MHLHTQSAARPSALALAVILNAACASPALAQVPPVVYAGPVLRYNEADTGAQHQAATAVTLDGNAVAVWFSKPSAANAQSSIRARRLDSAGTPLGDEIIVNNLPQTGDLSKPSVATDADGNFVVVWSAAGTPMGSAYHVFQRRFDRNGAPLGPQRQIDSITPEAHGAVVSMRNDGRYVIAWNEYPANGAQIRALGFDATGNPQGGAIVVASRPGGYAGPSLRVAGDDAGNFTVLWTHDMANGNGYDVFRRRFDFTGYPLTPVERVNLASAGNQRFADIAMDAQGNSVVIWDSYIDRYDSRIIGQRYGSNGQRLGGEFVLAYQASDPLLEPTRPAVGMARATGEFLAAWQRRNNTIFMRAYSAAGMPRGSEQLISNGVAGAGSVQVASDADGDASVAWHNAESTRTGDSGVVGSHVVGHVSIDIAARLSATVEHTTGPTIIDYAVEVENLQMPSPSRGVGTAGGFDVVLTLPNGGSVLDVVGTDWSCGGYVYTPTCSYHGTVAPGMRSEPLHVRIAGGPPGETRTTAMLLVRQYDPQSGNNTDEVTVVLP